MVETPSPGAAHGRIRAQRPSWRDARTHTCATPSPGATHGRARAQRPVMTRRMDTHVRKAPVLTRRAILILLCCAGCSGTTRAPAAGQAPCGRSAGSACSPRRRATRRRRASRALRSSSRWLGDGGTALPSSPPPPPSVSSRLRLLRGAPPSCGEIVRSKRARRAGGTLARGRAHPLVRAAKTCAFVCALAQRLLGPAGVSSFSRRATHRAHAASARA